MRPPVQNEEIGPAAFQSSLERFLQPRHQRLAVEDFRQLLGEFLQGFANFGSSPIKQPVYEGLDRLAYGGQNAHRQQRRGDDY